MSTPDNLVMLNVEPLPCGCSYCESARLQLADWRKAMEVADAAGIEAVAAGRLYLEMRQFAYEAHQKGPRRG